MTGDEALRQARESLGLILGVPEETGVSRDTNVEGLAQEATRACRTVETVDDRPDVLAATKNLDVAKRNLRNTWYSFIPVVTLQSTLSGTSAVNAGYPNPTWSIGAALSVPVFDGGTRLGTIKSQRAAQDIAERALVAVERQDLIQVEQTQRGIAVARQSYDVALRRRDLAAQNDKLTQALWSRGQGTSVDLVTASEAHRQAEQSLVVAEFGLVKAPSPPSWPSRRARADAPCAGTGTPGFGAFGTRTIRGGCFAAITAPLLAEWRRTHGRDSPGA